MNEQTHTTFGGEVKTPVIAGVEITTDKHGRFNLNALHKASGEGEEKRPGSWLRLASTKALIAEMKDRCTDVCIAPVSSTRGGGEQGTFAHELLAVDYAGWISPAFRLEVHQTFIDCRTGRAVTPALPAEVLDQIERSFGIMRMLAHKVTEIEKSLPVLVESLVDPMLNARLAAQNLMIRHGRTAGQIWADYNLPRLKNAPTWLGNRLSKMGCQVGGNGRAEIGGRLSRVYDPDKVSFCMNNGLLQTAKTYATERMGQRRLNLIGGGK